MKRLLAVLLVLMLNPMTRQLILLILMLFLASEGGSPAR